MTNNDGRDLPEGRLFSRWLPLLPTVLLLVFASTLLTSFLAARSHPPISYFVEHGLWFPISYLGMGWPERIWFGLGFSSCRAVSYGAQVRGRGLESMDHGPDLNGD